MITDTHNTLWASYQIRKFVGCACARNAGNVFPATDFKAKCKLAIPACIMARASRTCRDACRDLWSAMAGKTFPAFPGHAQPAILRIWQEAHGTTKLVIDRGRAVTHCVRTMKNCRSQNKLGTVTIKKYQATMSIYLRIQAWCTIHCEIGGMKGPRGSVSAWVHWCIWVAPESLRSHNAW